MPRPFDYDAVAAGFDRRYREHEYAGAARAIRRFVADTAGGRVLEVGCGTGHWLPVAGEGGAAVVGLDRSAGMLSSARAQVPDARLVRADAVALPFAPATFDRIFAINALHHFSDRARFFAEACALLRPGGGVMTVALDPHLDNVRWWVYDYFAGAREIDQARMPPTLTLRSELLRAGFSWCETAEVEHVETSVPAADAFARGLIDPAYTSHFGLIDANAFTRGIEAIRTADAARRAEGETLQLRTNLRIYATMGWL